MRTTIVVIALALLVGACAEPSTGPATDPTAGNNVTTTTSTEPTTGATLPSDDVAPDPQGRPATGPFYVESAQLIIAESFPIQVFVEVRGDQPTPCDEVDWIVNQGQDRIDIDLYTVADPAAVCIAVLHPVTFTIPLGSYETGGFTVYINDQDIGYFEA